MIEFIIYQNELQLDEYYKMIIFNLLGCREEEFKIYEYNNYEKEKSGNKIYLLCTKNLKQSLEKANEIRNIGDWNSQIIIISNLEDNIKHNKLLILDYINMDENLKDNLKSTLLIAYKILTSKETFNFVSNKEIYNISYRDILYIEKSINLNHCLLYTKNNCYIVKNTIKEIETQLDPTCFMKTHRSCIINLLNIKCYNYTTNTVHFCNREISLISREKRAFLKEKLTKNKVTV